MDEFELGDGIGLVSEIKALEVQKPNPENRAGLKRLKTDFWRKMVAFAIKSGASLEAMKIIDGFRKVDFGEW